MTTKIPRALLDQMIECSDLRSVRGWVQFIDAHGVAASRGHVYDVLVAIREQKPIRACDDPPEEETPAPPRLELVKDSPPGLPVLEVDDLQALRQEREHVSGILTEMRKEPAKLAKDLDSLRVYLKAAEVHVKQTAVLLAYTRVRPGTPAYPAQPSATPVPGAPLSQEERDRIVDEGLQN